MCAGIEFSESTGAAEESTPQEVIVGDTVRLTEPSISGVIPVGSEGQVVGINTNTDGLSMSLDAMLGRSGEQRLYVVFPEHLTDQEPDELENLPAGWEAIYSGQVEVIAQSLSAAPELQTA